MFLMCLFSRAVLPLERTKEDFGRGVAHSLDHLKFPVCSEGRLVRRTRQQTSCTVIAQSHPLPHSDMFLLFCYLFWTLSESPPLLAADLEQHFPVKWLKCKVNESPQNWLSIKWGDDDAARERFNKESRNTCSQILMEHSIVILTYSKHLSRIIFLPSRRARERKRESTCSAYTLHLITYIKYLTI